VRRDPLTGRYHTTFQLGDLELSALGAGEIQVAKMQCTAVQFSAVQYSTVYCSTVYCTAVQYSALQSSASAVQDMQNVVAALSCPSIYLALERAIVETSTEPTYNGLLRNYELALKVGQLSA
jgi:hypothetical protein